MNTCPKCGKACLQRHLANYDGDYFYECLFCRYQVREDELDGAYAPDYEEMYEDFEVQHGRDY